MGNTQSEKLYTYCQKGDPVKVSHLLEYQTCNINWKNPGKHYRTPLIIASKKGHVEIVRLLLSKRANTGLRDWFGWNALDYACYKGHYEAVDLLTDDPNWIRNGKTVYNNESSLHIATRSKHVMIVDLLLKKGGKAIINDTTIKRNTALHYAIMRRDIQLVQLLLANGASTRYRNLEKHNPLQLANSTHFTEAADQMKTMSKSSSSSSVNSSINSSIRSSSSINSGGSGERVITEVPLVEEEEDEEEERDNNNEISLDHNTERGDIEKTTKVQCSIKCILSGPPQVGKSTFKERITENTSSPLSPTRKDPVAKGRKVSHGSEAFSSPSRSVLVKLDKITKFRQSISSGSDDDDSDNELEKQNDSFPFYDFENGCQELPPFKDDKFTENRYSSLLSLDEVSSNSCSLHIIDTNSQPEFHEILPLILEGPALHLVFFDISTDLTKEIHIKGESGYETRYTQIQILHQLLSSYYDSGSQHSKAILIATHTDKVTEDVENVKRKVNSKLKKYLGSADFVTKSFLVPDPNTGLLFMPVDNVNDGEIELKSIVAHFQEIIDRNFPLIEIPYSWALFQYTLQQRFKNSGLCSYSDCLQIAKECMIEIADVPKVLNFIHHNNGTILHYEGVEGLRDVVICNPDHLFSSIKEVIFDACRDKEIRETGEIPGHLINKTGDFQKSALPIKEWQILQLLQQYNILTQMSPKNDNYFVSSLLYPDTSLVKVTEEVKSSYPLLISFRGSYIPIGLFSALIVKLAQVWTLQEGQRRYSNNISFLTRDGNEISLLSRMSHLEVQVQNDDSRFRRLVYSTIDDTLSNLLRSKKMSFSFGFYCPHSSPYPHFNQLFRYSNNDDVMMCKYTRCANYFKRIPLSSGHRTWLQTSPDLVLKDSSLKARSFEEVSEVTPQDYEIKKLKQQLESKEEELEECKKELDAIKTIKSSQNRDIENLRQQLSHKKEELEDKSEELKEIATKKDSSLKARSFETVNEVTPQDYEIEKLKQQLESKEEELEEWKEKFDAIKSSQNRDIENLTQQLSHKKEELEDKSEELKEIATKKDVKISSLEEKVKDQKQHITILEEEIRREKRLRDILARLNREFHESVKNLIIYPIIKTIKDSRIGIMLFILLIILISLSYRSEMNASYFNAPLPGIEVLATKRLTVTGGQHSHLHWDEFGLRIDIPYDALPSRSIAHVVVHVSKSGPYVYPDTKTWNLASGIYWMTSSKNFVKPILIGIWHNVGEFSNSSKLRFITSHDDPIDSKYVFRPLDDGFFSSQDCYGYILTDHFSGFGVESMRDLGDKFFGNLLQRTSKVGNKWDYSFVIYEGRPNGMSQQLMHKAGYVGWKMDPPVIVEFESDFIMLNLSTTSRDSKGWAVTATFPPAEVYKKDIVNGNIISNMQFFITWRGHTKKPNTEPITISLSGSRRPTGLTFLPPGDTVQDPCGGEPTIPARDIPAAIVLHLDEITEVMQLCIHLELPYSLCNEIQQTHRDDISGQKIILIQKWYEMSICRTWKTFVRALVFLRKCRNARKLAEEHQVMFYENEKDYERIVDFCPTLS